MDLPNTIPNQIMFSLEQNEDLVDPDDHPCLISFQQEDQTQDLYQYVPIVDKSSTRKRSGNRLGGGSSGSKRDSETDPMQKKMVHREIERQRRQDMTKLYASLKDLLPLQFIKGNRSISDHMNQAVHYIKEMEEKIKALSSKRDQLKRLSNTNENSTNNLPNKVLVSLCNGGVEISIDSGLIENGFMLSKVLDTLAEESLNVTSCTLTKVKDRIFHSIQTEVAIDLPLMDPSLLQQRLSVVSNTHS